MTVQEVVTALTTAAVVADGSVVGVAVLKPDREAEPGWFVTVRTDGLRVRIDTATGAAPSAAAVNAVKALDLSDAAERARQDATNPDRKALSDQAAQAIADNNTFLALANPTTAQVVQQVRKLAQQNNALIKRLVQITT